MPIRWTTDTRCVAVFGEATSAQITAYRSPAEACRGTLMVVISCRTECGGSSTAGRSTEIQSESSFRVRPGARPNVLFWTAAAAA